MIYIASKTVHAQKWRKLRDSGVPINSTWIDEVDHGESESLERLWSRCIREASECTVLIVYMEQGEILKGAFIEVGAALAAGAFIMAVGIPRNFSFLNHKNVESYLHLEDAIRCAEFICRVAK